MRLPKGWYRPRYLKQRDQFRCGPIAIFNALKWAGVRDGFNAKQALPVISKMCECSRLSPGTYHSHMDKALRHFGKGCFRVRRVYTPKIREVEEHLRAGGAIILNYHWEDWVDGWWTEARHYVLVTDMSLFGEYFGVVNYQKRRPVYQRVHRSTFLDHIMRFRQPPFKGWFLTKV